MDLPPDRYIEVLRTLSARESWALDEIPPACTVPILIDLNEMKLIRYRFITMQSFASGQPRQRVDYQWGTGPMADTNGSWKDYVANPRHTEGIPRIEVAISDKGTGTLARAATLEESKKAELAKAQREADNVQVNELAKEIRRRMRDDNKLQAAIRAATEQMPQRVKARLAREHELGDDAVGRYHAACERCALTDAAGEPEGWKRLNPDERLAAALFTIGGVFDTNATESVVPYPTDPRSGDTPDVEYLWAWWLRRLWVRDTEEYRRTLRRGQRGVWPLEVTGTRSARTLEDIWHYVLREYDSSHASTQASGTGLPKRAPGWTKKVLIKEAGTAFKDTTFDVIRAAAGVKPAPSKGYLFSIDEVNAMLVEIDERSKRDPVYGIAAKGWRALVSRG